MANTPTPPKQGVRARERNALERISGLESDFQNIIGAVNNAFSETEKKLRDLSEVVDALVSLTGVETVQNQMKANRDQRAQQAADQAKQVLDVALLEGKIEQIEEIANDSIITGLEKDKDGAVIPPGYVQLAVSAVKPEFIEKMLGQKAGFTFPTENDGTFEVTGVYKAVPQPEAEQDEPKNEAPAEPTPAA